MGTFFGIILQKDRLWSFHWFLFQSRDLLDGTDSFGRTAQNRCPHFSHSHCRESAHNRVWNRCHGRELLSADAVSTVRPCCMFDRYRNQVFIFSRAVDCLSHYLRPKGFALPIIEQEVNVILQTGNTKRSNRTVKIPAKSHTGSTEGAKCDWNRNSPDSVVDNLVPL